jgi:hypothetical protein
MAKISRLSAAFAAIAIGFGITTVLVFAETPEKQAGVRSGVRPGVGCEQESVAEKAGAAVPAAPIAPASLPNLTGTYSGSDGGLYYMEQSGSQLWWAGLSINPRMALEQQWHRGLDFTNVFHGTIYCNGAILGKWADVPRGLASSTGTLTLAIGRNNDGTALITQVSATGGFGARNWRAIGAVNDFHVDRSTSMDIIARFQSVYKDQYSNNTFDTPQSLLDNLKPYRDATVFFGRVTNEAAAYNPVVSMPGVFQVTFNANANPPSVDYTSDWGHRERRFAFFMANNDGDGDIDFNMSIDKQRMERDFYSTGWGDRDQSVLCKKLTDPNCLKSSDGVINQILTAEANHFLVHVESIMYGQTGVGGGTPLLPGWADAEANSVLVNGRPVNGSQVSAGDPTCGFAKVCPYTDPANKKHGGIRFGNLLLSPGGDGKFPPGPGFGAYIRVTGTLVLDCGHGVTSPCYDDPADVLQPNLNQEIHPVYSVDIIRPPFRPEDDGVRARSNLTGTWGGSDGSTYYIRQVGNTVWWLGQMRERQPMQRGTKSPIIGSGQIAPVFSAGTPPCDTPNQCWAFANVFEGTISDLPDGSATIAGYWAGVQQSTSQGNPGGETSFKLDRERKVIVPSASPTSFPTRLQKLYEPEDVIPPISVASVAPATGPTQRPATGRIGAGGITEEGAPKQITIAATDQGSGVQNIWYRFYANGAAPPATYTFVPGATASFTLPGGSFRVDLYATDNAGNDETPHSVSVGVLTNKP